MSRSRSRLLFLGFSAVVLAAMVLLFSRVLAFVELAARELRYFWWLVLLVATGLWLAFFFRGRRDD